MELSKCSSEVGLNVSKEKPVPGWKKVYQMLGSENWQADIHFLMHATQKLVCPEESLESLQRDLEAAFSRIKEETCELMIQRIITHQLGWLVIFSDMERTTLKMIVERKEQQEELRKIKEVLAKKKEEHQLGFSVSYPY